MASLLKGRLSRPSSTKSSTSTPDTASLQEGITPHDAEPGGAEQAASPLIVAEDPATADNSESGKFRQLLGILRKALNVKDLSGLRVSLPAQLMEPVGNLEVWNYVDRPDFFAAMGESEDALERMLSVVRWAFTKDLKFIKNKIAKPYNSVLGEHFHAHFDTNPITLHPDTHAPEPTLHLDDSPSPEILANAGRSSSKPTPATKPSPSTSSGSSTSLPSASSTSTAVGSSNSSTSTAAAHTARVVFLNEQTSHHPPISHFMLEARGSKGRVRCVGADQLSAKFTGTNVKVFPGPWNRGLHVTLPDRGDEEYQITHPTATVAGLLRGAPYATIGENCYITCRGGSPDKRYRTILAYTDESWISRAKFAVEGVIYETTEGQEDEYTKIKQVPSEKIVATITGCWRGEVWYKLAGESTSHLLLDLVPLLVTPNQVAPLAQQDPLETRKVWDSVSTALLAKDFGTAGKEKTALEQRQRDLAEERKRRGEKYKPRFFEPASEDINEWDGRPRLTAEGEAAIEAQFKADY